MYIGAYTDPRTTTFVSCVEYVHQISKPRTSANVIAVAVTILMLVIVTLVSITVIVKRKSSNKNRSGNKNVEHNVLCVDGKSGSKRADNTRDIFLGNILLNQGHEQLMAASIDMKINRNDTHSTSVKCIPRSKGTAHPTNVSPEKKIKNRMNSSDMIRNTNRNSDSCRNDGAQKPKFEEHETENYGGHVSVEASKSRTHSYSAPTGIEQVVEVDIHTTHNIATVKMVSTAKATHSTQKSRKLDQSNDERIEATCVRSGRIGQQQFPPPLARKNNHLSTHQSNYGRQRADKSGDRPSMGQIIKTEIIYESLGEKNTPVICEYARINKRHC